MRLYLTYMEMGHHALAHGSTSLLVGKQWLGEMEMEERESGWFESKSSQSIHEQHNNRQGRRISCFSGSGVRQKYVEWVLVGCKI